MPFASTENLYLPGLQPNGMPVTLVDLPGYWNKQRSEQARGGSGDAYIDEMARCVNDYSGRMHGLVVMDQFSTRTGKVLARTITHNVETDTLINNMLKLIGSTGASSSLGQYLGIDTATAAWQQSGSTISSGAQTAITVAGNTYTAAIVTGNAAASFQAASSNNGTGQNVTTPGVGAVPDPVYGTGIIWSFGTANAETVSGTTGSTTATSIPITSYTVAHTHTAGDWVVASPSTKDGPASAPAGLLLSTSITATYTTTAGVGNRKAQLVFTFAAGSTPGLYTGLWVATFATVGAYAASGCYAHVSTQQQTLNSSTGIQSTYIATL